MRQCWGAGTSFHHLDRVYVDNLLLYLSPDIAQRVSSVLKPEQRANDLILTKQPFIKLPRDPDFGKGADALWKSGL